MRTEDLDYLKHFAADPIVRSTFSGLVEREIESIDARIDVLAKKAFTDSDDFEKLRVEAKELNGRKIGLRRALAILDPEYIEASKRQEARNV